MGCEYICDGCGKREEAVFYLLNPHDFHKPEGWFQRSDKDGIQVACCRECIQKVAEQSGKTPLVMPW